MDFKLSKEQQMLREMYREFCQNEVKPIAADVDENERFPWETVEKMAKLGLLGICFPREYGGAGADIFAIRPAVPEPMAITSISYSPVLSFRVTTRPSATSPLQARRPVACSKTK